MHRATAMPFRKVAYHDETETVQMRLYKSLKVWSMYADLEESFGTFKVYILWKISCSTLFMKIFRFGNFFIFFSFFTDMQSCIRQNYRFKNCHTTNYY